MIVGVLALQGDFAEHLAVLRSLHVAVHEVRSQKDLPQCTHLIIPGGESTVMERLMRSSGLWNSVRDRAAAGDLAIFGTCAGAILLARDIQGKNAPQGLGLMDITIDRNAYGSQMQSFDVKVNIAGAESVHGAFIRAPKITRVGSAVHTLACHDGSPVLVRQGRMLAGTFHPEARGECTLHKMFLVM